MGLHEGNLDPFANEDADAAATTGEAPLGSSAAIEDPWAKGFRAEDSEKGGVFEEIYKEEAASSPAPGKAAPAGDDELWTLGVEEEKDDPFAAAVLEEGIEGIGGEDGGLVELDVGGDEDAGRQRLENKRESRS